MSQVGVDRGAYAAALLFAIEPSDRALAGWGGGDWGPAGLARWTLRHGYPLDVPAPPQAQVIPGTT